MNSPWKLTLLLVGIFLAGAATGGFVAQKHLRKEFARRFAPGQMSQDRLAKLAKHLELTPEQLEKVKPIVQRDSDELLRTFQSGFAQSRRIIGHMDREISALLTPEQRVKFEKMNLERRMNLRRLFGGSPSGKPANESENPGGTPAADPADKPAGGN